MIPYGLWYAYYNAGDVFSQNLYLPLLRKTASAVILAVKAVLGGKFNRPAVSVFLFEIRRQPGHAVLPCGFFPGFVQDIRIFQRAYGQRRRETIEPVFLCGLCCFPEAHFKADPASLAAFPVRFMEALSAGMSGLYSNVIHIPVPGGETQLLPLLPRPAVCSSATTRSGPVSPLSPSSLALRFVESMLG